MTEKDAKVYLVGVLGLGGLAALTLGGAIGRQLPPIWPFVILSVGIAGVAIWKFYKEGISERQRREEVEKAEEQARLEAEAKRIAEFDAEGARLQRDQKGRTVKLAVEELVDYADDLDSVADKARLLSAMGESVARLIEHREHLFTAENRRLIPDLQLVMERIDAADLSQRITAGRLRGLLSEGESFGGKPS